MSTEPESLVFRLLRDIRADIGDMRGEVADLRAERTTKADLRSEIHALRADVASDQTRRAGRSPESARSSASRSSGSAAP